MPQFNGFYEHVLKALMPMVLDQGSVVMDCGANVGKHTLAFARHVGDGGMVHAIEPNPETFTTLSRRVSDNVNVSRVALHHAAVGAAEGAVVFHMNKDRPALSSLLPDHAGPGPVEQVTVNTLVIDKLMQRTKRLDFMKIDVEGFEFEVFKGARKTITKHRPIVFFENNREMGVRNGLYTREEFLGYFNTISYLLCAANGMTIDDTTWKLPGPTNFVAFPKQQANEVREAITAANCACLVASLNHEE